MSNPLFSYTLEKETLELVKREGVLIYKRTYPINSPTIRIRVDLSRYLCGALRKYPEKFIGVKFTSSNQERNYDANPFKLIHFTPGETSDVSEHFRLEMVDEMSPTKEVKTHLDGTTYTEYKDRSLKPKYYKRYVQSVNVLRLEHLPSCIKLVPPQLEILK